MSEKAPVLRRIINFIVGSIYVILALYVAVEPEVAIESLIQVLGIVLIFSGLLRVINSFVDQDIGGTHRVLRSLLGLAGLFLGIAVIGISDSEFSSVISLISIGLLFQGITRLNNGLVHSGLPNRLRILLTLFGLITIILSTYVLFNTDSTVLTLLVYLSYGFMLNGFGRILMAIAGYSTKKEP